MYTKMHTYPFILRKHERNSYGSGTDLYYWSKPTYAYTETWFLQEGGCSEYVAQL